MTKANSIDTKLVQLARKTINAVPYIKTAPDGEKLWSYVCAWGGQFIVTDNQMELLGLMLEGMSAWDKSSKKAIQNEVDEWECATLHREFDGPYPEPKNKENKVFTKLKVVG